MSSPDRFEKAWAKLFEGRTMYAEHPAVIMGEEYAALKERCASMLFAERKMNTTLLEMTPRLKAAEKVCANVADFCPCCDDHLEIVTVSIADDLAAWEAAK